MKKIVLWFATTFTIVVLLFGYRTSTNTTTAAAASSAVSPSTGNATTPGTTAGATSGSTGTTAGSTGTASTAAGNGNAVTAPSSSSSSGTTSTATSTEAAASTTTTYTGQAASTRWGDVQVSITVTDGTITAVDVPVYPTGNGKDQQINARALPVLVKETLSSQSAKIDMVSGATVTSDGYLESLQSALDQAGL